MPVSIHFVLTVYVAPQATQPTPPMRLSPHCGEPQANLHTVEYPAGAIRGQLIEVGVAPEPAPAPLTPIEPEVPAPTPAPSAGMAASLGKAATLVAVLLAAALF